LSLTQKNLISFDLERWRFIVLFCDAYRCVVVAMHRGFWLRVPHVREGESKNNACLAIMVKGTQFALGGQCNDEA
jgi:hypothetical protein